MTRYDHWPHNDWDRRRQVEVWVALALAPVITFAWAYFFGPRGP